jgi:hypothetical protein
MRHFVYIIALATSLTASELVQSAPVIRRIVVEAAEDPVSFTELRARVDQKTGKEDVRLVITASAADTPLDYDSARFMTEAGPVDLELQHGRERLFACPEPGCPEHDLVDFDISPEQLSEFVGEGAPWRIYLRKDGRTAKTLLVPAAAIADVLDRISAAHRR